jgi:hypothetical protein
MAVRLFRLSQDGMGMEWRRHNALEALEMPQSEECGRGRVRACDDGWMETVRSCKNQNTPAERQCIGCRTQT